MTYEDVNNTKTKHDGKERKCVERELRMISRKINLDIEIEIEKKSA